MHTTKIHFDVRRFRPEFDCSAIGTLYQTSIENLARADYEPEALAAWCQWGKNTHGIGLTLNRGQTLIAQYSGRIAGFAQRQPKTHINMLYIHPDFARRGIGKALVEELALTAKREGVMRLTVNASRTSRGLFEKAGFIGSAPEWVERENVKIERFPMSLEL
ncbi:GNAT family N-acetyltransferase [Marinobacter fonticola]|uniref:GNAT family N-acetyltransferase n=1 Tax=Marinobacter fonticola TaxID=2603215 RepID=UPI0011E86EBA|nr:GNAT family N-acetyltransferase [Marinobacter fonticola]